MAEERYHHQEDFPYYEESFYKGKLMYELFASGFANGEAIHPSSRVDYVYDGNSLVGETVTSMNEDGDVVSTVNYEWYSESSGLTETRRKVRVQ